MPALVVTLETSSQDSTLCPIPAFSSELEITLCGIIQQSDFPLAPDPDERDSLWAELLTLQL